jgi:hypothetical protein
MAVMPEDENGQAQQVLSNGGSYTVQVVGGSGSVVASQDVRTTNDTIAISKTLR